MINVLMALGVFILMSLAYIIGYLTAENKATKERIEELEAERRAKSPYSFGPWKSSTSYEEDA